jgi:hypothetical protein
LKAISICITNPKNLKCSIFSLIQVVDITADVEWKLTGNGPWNIGTDFELIHTPGHTEVRNPIQGMKLCLIVTFSLEILNGKQMFFYFWKNY